MNEGNEINMTNNQFKEEDKSNIDEDSLKLDIIDHQLKYGRESIIKLNCDLINDFDTKSYCNLEQKEIADINITWENVLNKGDEYILTFNC
jgi:hypothetical protein